MSLLHSAMSIAETARISVPTVLDSMLGSVSTAVCDARLDGWSRRLLDGADVSLDVRGKQNAGDGSEALVVMSNHQSLFDIPVLFQSVPGRLRMVAKAELFRVPIWGKAMLAAGFVRIDRADRTGALASLRDAGGGLLESGVRVWIAPEGTRSRTGEVGPFKSGGFRMALDAKVRILPVAIDGTRRILPAKGAAVRTGQHVRVTILPPVDPAAFGVEGRTRLVETVRSAIADTLQGG